MLACGLPAVAVGGSEPELLRRLDGAAHVHKARGVGAAGVAEALAVRGAPGFAPPAKGSATNGETHVL
jgi:hypothetical protein